MDNMEKSGENEKDCLKTRKKKFNVGTVVMELQNGDTVPKGLVLKRELNIRECRYIMKNLLMIDINTEEDCFDSDEYKEYNSELKKTVNDWLRGDAEDYSIMKYAYDCSDEPIGIMNLIPIIMYLKKREII